MFRWGAAALWVMGMASMAGCTAYREVTVEGVEDVQLMGMDPDGLALRVDVRVNNPNGYRIRVHEPELDLYLNGTRIGTAVLDTPLTVPARSTSTVRIPLHARVDGGPLLVMGLGMLLGDRPVLRAEGTVGARAGPVRKRFPIRLEAPLQR